MVLGVPIKVLWDWVEVVSCAEGSRLSDGEGGGGAGLVRGLRIGWDEGVGWGWGCGGVEGGSRCWWRGRGRGVCALFAYERGQSRERCPLTPQRLQGLRSRHTLVSCSPPHTTVQAAAK